MAMSTFDGDIVRANDAFAGMLGWSSDDLIGMQVADLTHPDDRERDLANLGALQSSEQARQQVTKRYLHRDGHAVSATVWVSAMAPQGRGSGIVLAHIMSHDGPMPLPVQIGPTGTA
jgi:PAS domain S-box-containing protein